MVTRATYEGASLAIKSKSKSQARGRAIVDAAMRIAMAAKSSGRKSFPLRTYAVKSQAIPRVSTRQVGRVGLPRDPKTGLVYDDPTLAPYVARGFDDDLGQYVEMWRSDGLIAGTLDLIAREIARAPLRLKQIKGATPGEQRALDLAARYLGLDGSKGWLRGGIKHHLRHSVRRSLQFGHVAYEVTWAQVQWTAEETALAPCNLHYRAPNSTWGWLWSADVLKGLIQRVELGSSLRGIESVLGAQTVTIPSHRLLLYTHNGSALDGTPEGVSMLRPAWIWWRSKRDVLLRYHEASDNLFGGVTKLEEIPHPKTGDQYASNSNEDLDGFDDLMDQYDAGSLGYFFQPLGYKITQEHPEFDVNSPEKILGYFDRQISLVFTAQLIGQNTPTTSLATGAGQLLYNAIAGIAEQHLETFNGVAGSATSGILARLVDANIAEALDDPGFRYPELEAVGIEFQDAETKMNIESKGGQFKRLSYTVEDEIANRARLGMPPLTTEQIEKRREWENARLESDIVDDFDTTEDDQDRGSEEGTQAPIEPPEMTTDVDPEGF